jgi:ribosomal protein S18 acetylase RimI-like enzyme
MMKWKSSELIDKAQILSYLEKDRLYAVYAIGDLEPELFAQSTWCGAETKGCLDALILHFRGLKLPALFLMGNVEGLRFILENTLRPERVYLTCRREHLQMTRAFYGWDEPIAMWRMVLKTENFKSVPGDCIRLTQGHSDQLKWLYAREEAVGFSETQIEHGVFYGIFVNRQLVAAAGTHLVGANYGVAAVGNVFTHPECRGRGYATAATSAVVSELVKRGIRDIVLNVRQDNAQAIHIYEKLGFERYCAFFEGRACLRTVGNRQ